MRKILFVVPPYVGLDGFLRPAFNERAVVKKGGTFGSLVTDMPLGLLSLSAYVRKRAGAEVRLLDFNILLNKMDEFPHASFQEFFREVLSRPEWAGFAPDVIGISALFTPAYRNLLEAGRAAREMFPSALLVAGGGVPVNMYREIFRDSDCFDALCYGEGEKPLLGLVLAPAAGKFLRESRSWVTREKAEAGESFEHDLVHDLDDIPFYDYGLLDPADYGLSPTVNSYASFNDRKLLFHMATSRGCTHRCCFCASHTVHGRRMRYHSAARVREDLVRLRDQFGAGMIGFQDDNFTADRRRALEIIGAAKELELQVFFQSGLALYALDRTMLEAIKAAGLREVVLAIESGSERVLREVMHKPINLAIVRRVVADCRELGLDTDANILIGLPGETKRDMEDSLAFLKTLDANWFRIYVATPLAGSEMLEICLRKNYLKGSHIGSDFKRAVIETEDFTAEYVQEKAYAMNLELNFVNNSDLRLGNYEKALKGFENAIRVKSDHALAYYFAARACEKLGLAGKAAEHKAAYRRITASSDFWRGYAERFGLPATD